MRQQAAPAEKDGILEADSTPEYLALVLYIRGRKIARVEIVRDADQEAAAFTFLSGLREHDPPLKLVE